MTKTLEYTVTIGAPRALVWDTMFAPETYRQWAAPFCAGTYFEGSWDEGAAITFLTPEGDGMIAEIAENRPHEYVSVRHLGEVKDGVEDRTCEWAPAYENFAFEDSDNGTRVTVRVDSFPGLEEFMDETYPKALAVLKELCESAADAA